MPPAVVNEDRWTVRSKSDTGAKGVAQSDAVVVNYNEPMESKREKLGVLMEREARQGRSLDVRQNVLGFGQPRARVDQFGGSVKRWDEDSQGDDDSARIEMLRRDTSRDHKRPNAYDLEYDRGKQKKVKAKNKRDWTKKQRNPFQEELDLKRLAENTRRPVPSKPVRM